MRKRAAFPGQLSWIAALLVVSFIPAGLYAQDRAKTPDQGSKPAQKSNSAQGSKPALGPPVVISSEKYQQTHAPKNGRKPVDSARPERPGSRYPVQFFSIRTTGECVVFVIDNSTSMLDGNRRELAHAELLRSVRALRFPQKFHVIAFDAETFHAPWGPFISAQSDDSRKLAGWLSRLTPMDGTMPESAIRQAVGLNPDAVFFLTDGQFDKPTAAQIQAWNRFHVPIHVIDLSPDGPIESLKKIAGDSGGIYRKSP